MSYHDFSISIFGLWAKKSLSFVLCKQKPLYLQRFSAVTCEVTVFLCPITKRLPAESGKKGREAPHRPSLGGKKPLPRQEKVLQETGKSAAAIRKKDCGF